MKTIQCKLEIAYMEDKMRDLFKMVWSWTKQADGFNNEEKMITQSLIISTTKTWRETVQKSFKIFNLIDNIALDRASGNVRSYSQSKLDFRLDE